MSDYIYRPSIEENVEASTSITELDEIDEIVQRHTDEFSKVPINNEIPPDILKNPLYMASVPENKSPIIENLLNKDSENKPESLGELSLNKLFYKISKSFMDILSELINLKWDSKFYSNFTNIFMKDDRLLSVGILLVVFSVFMVFLRKT